MAGMAVVAPWRQGWEISEERREAYRRCSLASARAKEQAAAGEAVAVHPVYRPRLDPATLMPAAPSCGLSSLSLFSGGGGLDIGFERAGFAHLASFEILEQVAQALTVNRPGWDVRTGRDGDVRHVDWREFAGKVDVLHGGPPCQPFSAAGRQMGERDGRDMIPAFVRAVEHVRPKAFVMENVAALGGPRFADHLDRTLRVPLRRLGYHHAEVEVRAQDFGVPQVRRRLFFIGFADEADLAAWAPPPPTHAIAAPQPSGNARGPARLPILGNQPAQGTAVPPPPGIRWALGLPDAGRDGPAPTLRSGLTGPRRTTSVLNSAAAMRQWEALGIWPNGVARTRKAASAFPARNGLFRLSVEDVALIQCFPGEWVFGEAVCLALGQIGNSVAPPVAWAVATSVRRALLAGHGLPG